MVNTHQPTKFPSETSIAIVRSRFNHRITGSLQEGSVLRLEQADCDIDEVDVYEVPGAFEIPQAVQTLLKHGDVSGVIALGCVIRGETPHFEYVCNAVTDGLSTIGFEYDAPISFGILTTDNREQAAKRAGRGDDNKGYEAAEALLEMLKLNHYVRHS